jgi:hypothetical protein
LAERWRIHRDIGAKVDRQHARSLEKGACSLSSTRSAWFTEERTRMTLLKRILLA